MNNMPPLPATKYTTDYHMDGRGFPVFTAEQLQDYVMLCVSQALDEKRLILAARFEEMIGLPTHNSWDKGYQAGFLRALEATNHYLK